MNLQAALVVAVAATAWGKAVFPPAPSAAPPNAVDGAYVIQLKQDIPSPLSPRSPNGIGHEAFHKRAAATVDYDVRREFNYPNLFYGLSVTVKAGENESEEDIKSKLEAIEGVDKVWPVLEVQLNAPRGGPKRRRCVPRSTTTSATSTTTTATTTNSLKPPKVTGDSDVSSSLKMADVDKLHALGIKGKGAKIGIVDTGVDYRHPSLGGGFGPGYKIAGGYAFIADDGSAVSIADPLSTCVEGGHGTHVSGIIGMEDPDDIGFGLVGVAPEAEIYMYKVFSCTGGAATDTILSALEQAYTDGVNIVSMSLGSAVIIAGYDPFQTMTSSLYAEGIAVIAAAGNDGASGTFYTSAPGVGSDVIAVGSIENTIFPTLYTAVDSTGKEFLYASVFPLSSPTEGHNVYVLGGAGDGCTEDQWVAAAAAVSEPADVIVLYRNDLTTCDTTIKTAFWEKYGFAYIMTYTAANTDPNRHQYVLLDQVDDTTLYTNLITEDALAIAANYAAAGGYPNYQIKFTGTSVTSAPMDTAGKLSYFSSYGPTFDTLRLKPQLSAPGASILATWPLGFNSGYAVIRGTSMATPFVAACYALVMSQRPDLSIWQIRELLQTTSTPAMTAYFSDGLATAVQQGSGLINPFKALQYTSTVTPGQFEIQDTDYYGGKQLNFTITNTASQAQTYQFSHKAAGMMEWDPYASLGAFGNITATYPNPYIQSLFATLSFSADEITIAAGASATVFFEIAPPTGGLNTDTLPVISGFVSISSDSGESFAIPYMGLPYSRHDAQQINLAVQNLDGVNWAPWPIIYSYDPRVAGYTFYNGSGILEIDTKTTVADGGQAGAVLGTMQPTADVRADLLPANTTFVPTHYGYDTSVKWDYVPITTPYVNFLPDGVTPTYGFLGDNAGLDEPFVAYLDWVLQGVTTSSGGTATSSPGDYRMLLSVLRWGGDSTNLDDWETWLSPIIRLT